MKTKFPVFFALFSILILMTASCARVSRERTLPPSINSIYIPMAVNRSAEIGIEEDLTAYIQEEFLADGRLELDTRRASDAHVIITITDFDEEAQTFDTENYPRRVRQSITLKIEIIQNVPGKPAFGPPRRVEASRTFNNDARTITYVPEPQGRDSVLRECARKAVQEVITGRFEDL